MNSIANYSRYLTPTSLARQPSAIRKLMPLLKQPGMVSLGGGLPNPAMFPFVNRIEFEVTLPNVSSVHPSSKAADGMISLDAAKTRKLVLDGKELEEALQYSATPGLPSLVNQLRDIQSKEHKLDGLLPGSSNELYDLSVTVGSQDALTKAFEMLLQNSDEVLLENPTYPGALTFLKPYGAKLTPINTDSKGLDPDHLLSILASSSDTKRRRVLYTIPTAQNPSGLTLDNQRRHAIYELACEHDLIILEDDPYYFLHPERRSLVSFMELDAMHCRNECQSTRSKDANSNVGKGGRVLRFDSFSKIFSAGMRIGFVTAPIPLLNRINLHIQGTNLHNCGISQAMVSQLLKSWDGWTGLDSHTKKVAAFYGRRRDWIVEAAEKYLSPPGSEPLASWTVPTAGMFLWLRLNNIDDTKSLIEEKAAAANVLFVPGQAFDPLDRASSYVRAAYSTASKDDMNVAMKRLADLIIKQ
jgi:kynurenine/2-aminoadipate aminotransferase